MCRPFCFLEEENGFQLVMKVLRKIGTKNVFKPSTGARRVWQVSLPLLSQALVPFSWDLDQCCNDSGSSVHFLWPLRHSSDDDDGCQGHRPSTKQGYLWLIENITGATCM